MGTSGHGPRSVFDAKIVKKDHPITQGLKDFQIFDELYSKLQGDGPIDVLVSAYSDWSEKEEPWSSPRRTARAAACRTPSATTSRRSSIRACNN
jgi:hypothetical protein